MEGKNVWEAGETIWTEGEERVPLRVRRGVAAYRRGDATVGVVGPGKVLLPIPGIPRGGKAEVGLLAVTELETEEVGDPSVLTQAELEASVRAVLLGADRLGNLTVPERLAALLLEVTELQGNPVVQCRQDIVAMATGARRETVAVILGQWRDYDWIQTRYRRVKVVHREALRQIATGGTPPPGVVSF